MHIKKMELYIRNKSIDVLLTVRQWLHQVEIRQHLHEFVDHCKS